MEKLLLELNACEEARVWAKDKTWPEIFNSCNRGDWLLWLFQKTMPQDESNLKLLTRAKTHCALTVKHLMKDQRSITACEVALKFSDGAASRKELNTAAYAAAYAAYAAAYAADAADAAYAAYAATGGKKENQKLTADICRKYLPIEVWNINL